MPDIVAIKRTLRGPMIPVITNLNHDLSIDHAAIRENVRFVIDRGIVRGQGVLLAVGAGGDVKGPRACETFIQSRRASIGAEAESARKPSSVILDFSTSSFYSASPAAAVTGCPRVRTMNNASKRARGVTGCANSTMIDLHKLNAVHPC